MSKKEGYLGNPESQQTLRQKEKDRFRQAKDDLGAVMSMAPGRRVLWQLIDGDCGVFSGTFTGNSETFYKEGRRSIGVELMRRAQMQHPEAYVQMVQEMLDAAARETPIRDVAEAAPANVEME